MVSGTAGLDVTGEAGLFFGGGLSGECREKQGFDLVFWRETRKLTKEYAPILFVCDFNEFDDCTER